MNTILPEILNSGKEKDTAITIPDKEKINYLELKNLVSEISEKLYSFGIQSERPIVIVLRNNAEFIISFLGVTNTSAVAAPLNPEFTDEEFNFYLDDINPSMVITSEGHSVIKQAKAKKKFLHQ
jgi:acyl-CoA synthetase (AMP-forming)/AMP-acid ligase II